MDALMNVTEFEAPDGYYFDLIIKTLYIFNTLSLIALLEKEKAQN